jgi:Rrf2 family protein
MVKLYSKGCEHILRIISKIPQDECGQTFLAKNLCRKSRVPKYSARKGLQLLVQQKILKALPGPGGGYKFVIHPTKTPLLDVIEAVDGKDSFKRCIMGLQDCNSKNPCPIHDTWKDLKGKLLGEFENKTLFELMSKTASKK